MNCPACKSTMLVMEYDGVELDHCPACQGTWFDGGELALLFAGAEAKGEPAAVWTAWERIEALPDAATDEPSRRCPRCRRRMRKVNIGPSHRVLIDACPAGDGLWFDEDEVAELARDLSATGGELSHRVAAFLGKSLGGSGSRGRKDTE